MKWFCLSCFKQHFKGNEHLREWVYQWQDNCRRWAHACCSGISDEALRDMEDLPEGLSVSADERARLRELNESLENVTDHLQKSDDNVLLHKIIRNVNKNPYVNDVAGTIKDYESTKADFENLEKLTPEAKRRLG